MLTAVDLRGLDASQQFERITEAVRDGDLKPTQAVALAAELQLPEQMQRSLAEHKLVVVGYGGAGAGGSDGHKPLPANNPVFFNRSSFAEEDRPARAGSRRSKTFEQLPDLDGKRAVTGEKGSVPSLLGAVGAGGGEAGTAACVGTDAARLHDGKSHVCRKVVVAEDVDALESHGPLDGAAVVLKKVSQRLPAGVGALIVDEAQSPWGTDLGDYLLSMGIPTVGVTNLEGELRGALGRAIERAESQGGLAVLPSSDGGYRVTTVDRAIDSAQAIDDEPPQS